MKGSVSTWTITIAGVVALLLGVPSLLSGQGREPPTVPPPLEQQQSLGSISLRWDYSTAGSRLQGDTVTKLSRSLLYLGSIVTVPLGEDAVLPIRLTATSYADGRSLPSAGGLLRSTIIGPGNLLLEPRVGWARASIGRFSPAVSELSGEGIPLVGAGVDLRPGNVRLMLAAGKSNAYRTDGSGAVSRSLLMASLGLGNDTGSHVHLNLIRARDHAVARLETEQTETEVAAGEGLLLSLGFVQKITGTITFDGEIAGSAYTRDLGSAELKESDQIASDVFRLHNSSRLDYAATLGAALGGEGWEVALKGIYAGPGYVPLASAFSDPDRLEFTVTPRLMLLENRLRIHGSFGHRSENLSGIAGNRAQRITALANITAYLSEAISLTATWNLFRRDYSRGLTSGRAAMASQSLWLMPTVTFSSEEMLHTLTGQCAIDRFDDRLLDGSDNTTSRTTTLGADYTGAFISRPLTVDLGINHSRTTDPWIGSTTYSARAGFSYRFPAPGIALSLGNTWTARSGTNGAQEQSLTTRCTLGWSVLADLRLTLAAYAHLYSRNTAHGITPHHPAALQTMLTKTF